MLSLSQLIANGNSRAIRHSIRNDPSQIISKSELMYLIVSRDHSTVKCMLKHLNTLKFDEEILLDCLRNGWVGIHNRFTRRPEYKSVSISSNWCLIRLIKSGNTALTISKLRNPALDFNSTHRETAHYIVRHDLINIVQSGVALNFNHDNGHLLRLVIYHNCVNIAKYLSQNRHLYVLTHDLRSYAIKICLSNLTYSAAKIIM